jgi:hypothetical protein
VDPRQKEDVERMNRLSPEERLRAVFDVVNAGVRIRQSALRAQHPDATDQEIQSMLREWLTHERDEP